MPPFPSRLFSGPGRGRTARGHGFAVNPGRTGLPISRMLRASGRAGRGKWEKSGYPYSSLDKLQPLRRRARAREQIEKPHGLQPFRQSHVQRPLASRRGALARSRHSGQRTGGAPLVATVWRMQTGSPATFIRARLSQYEQATALPAPSSGSPMKARNRPPFLRPGKISRGVLNWKKSCRFSPRRWRW